MKAVGAGSITRRSNGEHFGEAEDGYEYEDGGRRPYEIPYGFRRRWI